MTNFILFLFFFLSFFSTLLSENNEFEVKSYSIESAKIESKNTILRNSIQELGVELKEVIDEIFIDIANSEINNLIIDYKVLKEEQKDKKFILLVSGNVDKVKLKELYQNYKNNISPKILVFIEETIDNKRTVGILNVTENAFINLSPEFQYLNNEEFKNTLIEETKRKYDFFGVKNIESMASKIASNLGAEILIIGKTETRKGVEIVKGTFSIQTTYMYKVLNVATSEIITAGNSSSAYPHINLEAGAQKSIEKAINEKRKDMIFQIYKKWKRTTTKQGNSD